MSARGKIVIASGDKKNSQAIKNLLGPLNLDLSTYKDLKKLAVEIHSEKPDLLIFDADTVVGDSFDLAKRIKSGALSKLPIVVMTSNPADERMMKILKDAKIDEYVRKPISYSLLLEKMKKLLLVETQVAEDVFDDVQEFKFSGDLMKIPFARILYCLKRDARTGILTMTRDTVKKVISFDKGDPKFVVSNIVQECLGRLLVAKGRLTQEECEESLRLMKEWKKKQGETLIKMGLIEPYELDEALKMQAKERLLETFGWHNGDYKFYAKGTLREDLTPIDIEIPQIVLLGVRRFYTLDILKRFLDRWTDYIPVFSENPFFKMNQFRLATWDAKTSRLIDGKRTLKELISARVVREIDVYHLVFTFYALSVVKFVETDETKKTAMDAIDIEKEKLEGKNAFQRLNVSYDVGDESVKTKFDNLVLKYNKLELKSSGGTKETIKDILAMLQEAYNYVKDNSSRQLYLKKLFLEEGFFIKETSQVVTPTEVVARGKDYISRNEFSKAKLLFLNGISIFPKIGIIYSYLGYTLLLSLGKNGQDKTDELEEAEKYLKRGIRISQDEEDTHLFYGRYLKYVGKSSEAVREFKRVTQVNAYNNEALQELRLFNIRKKKKSTSFIKWKK